MSPSDDHHHLPMPGADALALLHSVTQHLGSAVALVDETGQWIFMSDAMQRLMQNWDDRLKGDLVDRSVMCIRQQSGDIFTLGLRHPDTQGIEQIHCHPLEAPPNGLCLLTASPFAASGETSDTSSALLSSLKQQAMTDPLTGLFNRRYLNREAPGLLQQAVATQKPLSLILLDLDHFKRINDTHGHVTGDQVLRIAASRMRAAVRPQDRVCRYGGEEFLVLLPETDIELAVLIAQRILHQLSQSMDCLQSQRLTASIGVSRLYLTEKRFESALIRADQALYSAKDAGRNCIKTCA